MGSYEELFKGLTRGDLVEFCRYYWGDNAAHWGVYVGGGMIVHMTGDPDDLITYPYSGDIFTIGGQDYAKARVRKTDFDEAAAGRKAIRNNSKDNYTRFKVRSPDDIIQRAESWIRPTMPYYWLTNSCQRFAEYCRYHDTKADKDFFFF